MTTKACNKVGRKHTPVVSRKQRSFFGSELTKAQKGKKRKTTMSMAELTRHLEESHGKKLPTRARTRKPKRKP